MNTKNDLLTKLKKQLELEVKARDLYSNYIKQIKDKSITSKIEKIRDEEIEHIEAVKRMIDIVKNYTEKIKKEIILETKNEAKVAEKITSKSNISLVLLSPQSRYMNELIKVVSKFIKDKSIVYISYNKISKYIKDVLEKHKVKTKDILFIDCTMVKNPESININPEDISSLAIAVNESAKKIGNSIAIFDTVSTMMLYYSKNTVLQFVASINNNARKNGFSVLWLAVDEPENKGLNDQIQILCDQTYKL